MTYRRLTINYSLNMKHLSLYFY